MLVSHGTSKAHVARLRRGPTAQYTTRRYHIDIPLVCKQKVVQIKVRRIRTVNRSVQCVSTRSVFEYCEQCALVIISCRGFSVLTRLRRARLWCPCDPEPAGSPALNRRASA